MKEDLKIEGKVAALILNNGVRYNSGSEEIVIRPLLFGTTITICEKICEAGLTFKEIEDGENEPAFLVKYASLMERCVAIAELGKKELLTKTEIENRAMFYRWNLTAFQIYELFVHIVNLSGMEDFMNTIKLMWTLKKVNLSPARMEGS
jgi:hypothetical protein